jgi:ketosteroid isomerase-like protein
MPLHALPIAALAVALATSGPDPHATWSGPERDALERRQAGFLAALSARDLERTSAHFADDAVMHVANMPPITGREAIRQFYGKAFRFLAASTSVAETTRVSQSGDMGFGLGRTTNVFEGKEGRVEYEGKFLLFWEKREGEWSIAAYTLSSNRPDPAR